MRLARRVNSCEDVAPPPAARDDHEPPRTVDDRNRRALDAEGAEMAIDRPDHAHHHRVDPGREEERVARVRGHLAALGHGAADDGGGGGGEGELEEPRVVRVLGLELAPEDELMGRGGRGCGRECVREAVREYGASW